MCPTGCAEAVLSPVATPAGPSAYHLIATLTFDNIAAIQNAFGTPEGQAAAADVGVYERKIPQLRVHRQDLCLA